jgi:Beta-galactosidase/beta-glucuronidase
MFSKKWQPLLLVSIVLFCAFQVQARVSKGDALFNLDWKFTQGNPTNAQSPTFSDAAWTTVSVPHSASYDAPDTAGELHFYGSPAAPNKDYWYRKSFLCPANAKKVFIQFEGVMQSATVFVNGTQVGTHYNSGYTGFFFDISNNIARGASTLIAVHCNINNDPNIPPGGSGWTSNGGAAPDFLLYSGMYRNVRLLFKDSVYVPLRGQRITTTSSTIRALTNVRNDGAASSSVTVTCTVRNSGGSSVGTATATQSVPANGAYAFDLSPTVSSPSAWSPTSPTLYSVETMVSAGGVVVDSVVEKVGFRSYAWSSGTPGGLSINGTRTELMGVCMGQWMGWIENAVPDSRFAKQVAMIKDMGINSIRTSHYPRAEAFYHACDSLGVTVLCEVPGWGVSGGFGGLTTFWNRMYSCDSEMVFDAYNHPCIWGWSLFNEPSETNLGTNFATESSIIHAIDPVSGSGRVTLVANYAGNVMYPLDVYGLNYSTSNGASIPIVNTEDYQNWFRAFVRGDAMDLDVSGSSEAAAEVNQMKTDWSTSDKCAGAHFWCFMDYCSFRNQTGREGLVDRLYIPKNVYYMFKYTLKGGATDYWTNGTPTTIDLKADLTTLRADGSDISQIVATLRTASGACVQPSAGCNITFTASPAGCVSALYSGHSTSPTSGNPVTCAVEGGRAGVLLRTSRTAGAITVTAASSCGLTSASATVNLTSTTVSESFASPVFPQQPAQHLQEIEASKRLAVSYTGKGAVIIFPPGAEKTVCLLNCQGKTVAAFTLKERKILVDRHSMANGIVYVAWKINGRLQPFSNIVLP